MFMYFSCQVEVGIRVINLEGALEVDPIMVIEGAPIVIKKYREKAFDSANTSGGFGLGKLLVRCGVAQVVSVGSSNVFSTFKDDRAEVLVGGEDDKFI